MRYAHKYTHFGALEIGQSFDCKVDDIDHFNCIKHNNKEGHSLKGDTVILNNASSVRILTVM